MYSCIICQMAAVHLRAHSSTFERYFLLCLNPEKIDLYIHNICPIYVYVSLDTQCQYKYWDYRYHQNLMSILRRFHIHTPTFIQGLHIYCLKNQTKLIVHQVRFWKYWFESAFLLILRQVNSLTSKIFKSITRQFFRIYDYSLTNFYRMWII